MNYGFILLDLSGRVITQSEMLVAISILIRLSLSVIALAAGVGKLLDPTGSRQAIGDFGVPARWVDVISRALPSLEIGLGLLILIDFSSKIAAIGLTLLFSSFTLGIINLLRQDKTPPCNCFGAIHSEPVTRRTLARAILLMTLSLCLTALPPAPLSTSNPLGILGTTLIYLTGGIAIKYTTRWRSKRDQNQTMNRLSVGQRIPAIQTNDSRWLDQLLAKDSRTLILVTDPHCGPCARLKDYIKPWIASVTRELQVLELRLDGEDEFFEPIEGMQTYRIDERSFNRLLMMTPGGILVDGTGSIVSPPVLGIQEIEALIRLTLANDSNS